jgi:predicted Zn-dependent peptidase
LIKEAVLTNGIKLITEEMPYVNSVSIGFWIKVGSRNEPADLQGITHFIEHLLFRGTTMRTTEQIAAELENVGGSLNAFTSREYTCIYARVLAEDLTLAIDLLADMFANSIFNNDDIEKEKKIISEEIMMYEDTPDEYIHDLFTQKVWANHSLGRAILGTTETVFAFTKEQVLNYYHENFTPDNLIVSAAGNLSHDFLTQKLTTLFKKQTIARKIPRLTSSPRFNPVCFNKVKDTEQNHICIGTETLSQRSDEIYSLMVYNNLLGGGSSSRLFQSIRENLGLAYSIYSYISLYSDKGLFIIYAGTNPDNSHRIIDEIIMEVDKINSKKILYQDFIRSKNHLKGSILLSAESVGYKMIRNGRTEIFHGRIIPVEEVIEKIQTVTLDEIYNLAKRIGDFSSYSLISIAPGEITSSLEDNIGWKLKSR